MAIISAVTNIWYNYATITYSETNASATRVVIERSVNSGTYVAIQDTTTLIGDYIDHDVVHSATNEYRLLTYDGSNTLLSTSGTTVVSPLFKEWVLKDTDNYSDAETSVLFLDGSNSLQITNREDQARFTPLGRKYPLVIKDAEVKGGVIPLTLQFMTHAEYEVFDTLRQRQKTLNLSGPRPQYNWYGVFASELEREILNDVDGYSLVRVDFIETGNL